MSIASRSSVAGPRCGARIPGVGAVEVAKGWNAGYFRAANAHDPGGHPGGGTPQMDSTSITSTEWLKIAGAAFAQTDGSAEAMAKAIAAQLASQPAAMAVAAALAEGFAELARYAAEEPGEAADSVDIEVEAIAAARRVVRPLLQAKLQQRLDALDAKTARHNLCPRCKKPTESQGRRSRGWGSVVGAEWISNEQIAFIGVSEDRPLGSKSDLWVVSIDGGAPVNRT